MRIFYIVKDLGDGESGVFFFNDPAIYDLFIDKAEASGDYVSETGSFSADSVTGLNFYSERDVLDMYEDFDEN